MVGGNRCQTADEENDKHRRKVKIAGGNNRIGIKVKEFGRGNERCAPGSALSRQNLGHAADRTSKFRRAVLQRVAEVLVHAVLTKDMLAAVFNRDRLG